MTLCGCDFRKTIFFIFLSSALLETMKAQASESGLDLVLQLVFPKSKANVNVRSLHTIQKMNPLIAMHYNGRLLSRNNVPFLNSLCELSALFTGQLVRCLSMRTRQD
jgi:hypothetical protein